jgi:hypothetical protein
VNRVQLQQLAEDRILDAQSLLATSRWSGAYYLAGYAVECGLKACVLNHVVNTGVIFQDKKYAERCWTHRPEELVRLADLEAARGIDAAADPTFAANWLTVEGWSERSRYETKGQLEAKQLFDAVNDPAMECCRGFENIGE